jgi:hypothetical protein
MESKLTVNATTTTTQSQVSVSDIVEAVAKFVEIQEGGTFDPKIIATAIRAQLEYGDLFKNIEPPSCTLPEYYREEWKRNVMLMWVCVRKHDCNIPSDVLDYMRDELLGKLAN